MGSQFPIRPKKPRVLVIEDEFMIAEMIRDILEEHGCKVIGPYGSLSDALSACQSVEADAAIVDLVLQDEYAYPIADVLARRGIPFGFATGRDTTATESAWKQVPFLGKPFAPEEVYKFVATLLPDQPSPE